MKITCLASGGMDSTVLLHRLKVENHKILPLYVNYGQKAHKKEFRCISDQCSKLGLSLNCIDISNLHLISSGLTSKHISSVDKPIFPNRNLILLSIATSFAFDNNCDIVAIALLGDSTFPDQSKEFVKNTEIVISSSLGAEMKIWTPFIQLNKLEVIRLAKKYQVDIHQTYSCYEGTEEPCEQCLGCKDRRSVLQIEHSNSVS